MPILELPNELIELIIQESLPEGFESLILTCKKIYALGKSKIPKHNSLKRKYEYFTYKPYRHFKKPREQLLSTIQLLHEIGQEPLIARYIRGADFKFERRICDSHPDLLEQLQADTTRNKGLMDLLENSAYLRSAEQDPQEWMNAILDNKAFDSMYATTFLLTLLPNVRTLALPASWRYFDRPDSGSRIWAVLDIIPERANNDSSGTASLGKVTTLEPSAGTGFDCCHSMQMWAPFLAIHSVCELYGGSLIALNERYCGYYFNPRYRNLGANLEHVELAGGVFGSKAFSRFVEGIKRLRTFKFSYQVKRNWYGNTCNVGEIVAILVESARESLENLALRMDCEYIETGVTDLRRLQRLKDLELDTSWLLGPPYGDSLDSDEEDTLDPDVPCLLDMIPPSIERIQLLTKPDGESMRCLECLFTDFVEGKDEALPNLESLKIRRGPKHWKMPKFPKAVLLARDELGVQLVDERRQIRAGFERD